MVKAEWGTKRICQECGTKFYDMGRAEIICPKCEAVFQIAPPKPKRVQPVAKGPAAEPPAAVAPAIAKAVVPGSAESDNADEVDEIDGIEDVVADNEDDDEDEDMIEDISDRGEYDDESAEVIQKPAPPDEN